MLNRFKNRFKNLKQKLLVSVSGGLDSMVLCDLLLKSDLDFSIAHVNYKLRKKESDFDENFVKNYANQNKLIFIQYLMIYQLTTNLFKLKLEKLDMNFYINLQMRINLITF